jgi:predicted secreted protein
MGLAMRLLASGLLAVACACATGTASSPGTTVDLGEKDSGQAAHVRVGDTVRVTLEEDFPVPGSALVWNVTSSDAAVLQPGAATRSPQVRSGPGGHDTYTAEFRVLKAGQAVLVAHGTTSCEAMQKQFCPDREFNITVMVAG